MKRIASILLLGILFFNWFGYRLLSDFLQQQANTQLEAQLDNNSYDESQLIEMRVTLNLPYQTNWSEFERVDGEIEIDGILYKYVKRKVENGQLVLLCLPNEAKMRLQTARDDFFKLVNDLQQSTQNKKSNTGTTALNSFSTEYWQEKNNWQIAVVTIQTIDYSCSNTSIKADAFLATDEQPPDFRA